MKYHFEITDNHKGSEDDQAQFFPQHYSLLSNCKLLEERG